MLLHTFCSKNDSFASLQKRLVHQEVQPDGFEKNGLQPPQNETDTAGIKEQVILDADNEILSINPNLGQRISKARNQLDQKIDELLAKWERNWEKVQSHFINSSPGYLPVGEGGIDLNLYSHNVFSQQVWKALQLQQDLPHLGTYNGVSSVHAALMAETKRIEIDIDQGQFTIDSQQELERQQVVISEVISYLENTVHPMFRIAQQQQQLEMMLDMNPDQAHEQMDMLRNDLTSIKSDAKKYSEGLKKELEKQIPDPHIVAANQYYIALYREDEEMTKAQLALFADVYEFDPEKEQREISNALSTILGDAGERTAQRKKEVWEALTTILGDAGKQTAQRKERVRLALKDIGE